MWWMWIVGFIVAFAVVTVLAARRRGSAGVGGPGDLPSRYRRDGTLDNSYPTGVGDAGGGGGGI